MGKPDMFNIIVNNPHGVCQAGDLLTGYVVVHLSVPMKMNGIDMTFKGKGHTMFARGADKRGHEGTATEYYFNDRIRLFDPGSSQTLLAGQFNFDFEYRLPATLPSSFEGYYGFVRYTLTSHVDIPWKFNHTTMRAFTVLSILDLNRLAEMNMPVQKTKQIEDACCGFCSSGVLEATITLQRVGFVPGEVLPYQVVVNNGTETDAAVQIELQQYTIYNLDIGQQKEKTILFQADIGTAMAKETQVFTTIGLRVPPVPPSDLVGCKIIHIQYLLKVHISANVKLKIPVQITVGTVPLRSVVEMYRPQPPPIATPESVALSVFPDPHLVPSAPAAADFVTDFNMPPPSYEECVRGKVDIRDEDDATDTHGNLSYAPVYTYYNWV